MKRSEFWFVLSSILFALHDAHSSMQPLQSEELIDLPFQWLRDGMIVTKNTDIFQKGDQIISVGDRSEAELEEALRSLVSAENRWRVRHCGETMIQDLAVLRTLRIAQSAPVRVVFDREGSLQTVCVPLGRKPSPATTTRSWARWSIDESHGLGILTLDKCLNDEFFRKTVRNFFEAVHESTIERIAVDVRNNGGGNSSVINEFLRYIDIRAYDDYSGEVRETRDSLKQHGNKGATGYRRLDSQRRQNEAVKGLPPFRGKLYILTSKRTFSSGNWFAVLFQDNRIGQVLGEPTGNAPSSFGDTLGFSFPESAYSLTLSYKKWVRPDPDRDPADSLVPDCHIPLTRQHIIDGVDPVIEYVRELNK